MPILPHYIDADRPAVLAERLQAQREGDNISAGEMARVLEISEAAYKAVERGEELPDLLTLVKIVALLEVRVHWLMGFDRPGGHPITYGNPDTDHSDYTRDQLQDELIQSEAKLIDLVTAGAGLPDVYRYTLDRIEYYSKILYRPD